MALAMAIQLLLSLTVFSLSSSSASAATVILSVDAAQVLDDLGMVSMSLTLRYGPQTLLPQTQNLTIFSPSDKAFANSGQPSLSLLRLHFSPQSLPLPFLNSLPFGSKIPTLSPGHSLVVDSPPSDDQTSLNGVKIGKKPVYDDGYLIVYKLDKFFDPSFKGSSSHGCVRGPLRKTKAFDEASGALRSKGYSAMAAFLDSQLQQSFENVKLTIFAPPDEVVKPLTGKYWDLYPSMFLKLIAPCKITGRDLVDWDNGTSMVETYLEGFNVTVEKSGGDVMINGVKIVMPDLFRNEWIVVHGLGRGVSARNGGAAENLKLNKILVASSYCLFLSLSFC